MSTMMMSGRPFSPEMMGRPYSPGSISSSLSPDGSSKSFGTIKQWQKSSVEGNYRPIAEFKKNSKDNVSSPIVRPQTTMSHSPSSTLSLPANFSRLDYHEQLHICGKTSPVQAICKVWDEQHPKYTSSEFKCKFDMNYANTGNFRTEAVTNKKTVIHGHDCIPVVSPSNIMLEAYRGGVCENAPLRIVTHLKRGVKLPKTNSENSPHALCRNVSGGFYATA